MTGYDDDFADAEAGYGGGLSPQLAARLEDASWAIAARDCAIEVGDRSAASDFAAQARVAIARAVEAGIDLPELAYELSYPGGHTAMDGPHVDDEIAALRPPEMTDQPEPVGRPTAYPTCLTAAAALAVDDEAADAARGEQLSRWGQDDRNSVEAEQAHADGWA